MYKLSQEQKTLVKNDKQNKKLWDEAMGSLSLGPVRMTVYNWSKLIMFVLHAGWLIKCQVRNCDTKVIIYNKYSMSLWFQEKKLKKSSSPYSKIVVPMLS